MGVQFKRFSGEYKVVYKKAQSFFELCFNNINQLKELM